MTVIRVQAVGGDFRVPRGWPQPTDQWIRENLFWQPPDGWVPREGLRPAPAGWEFWRPNPLWERLSAGMFRKARRWLHAANTFLLLSIVLAAGRFLLPTDMVLGPLSGVAFVLSVACSVGWLIAKHRITRQILIRIRRAAEDERKKRLVREYQSYLRDVT
jgi:hypothetical protein